MRYFDLDDNILSEIIGDIQVSCEKFPLPDEISYYRLEKERIIYLESNVDEDVMQMERLILRWNMEDVGIPAEQRKPIRLLIHSYGGDLDYMWGLIDAIETSATPVYTVNVGRACSAASLIFMAGKKRLMMPRSSVLIHEGSASMSGDATKVLDATDSYRKELKKMKEYIEARTSIPAKLLNKKRNNDWEIDAAFCLENGVCDVIVRSIEEVFM